MSTNPHNERKLRFANLQPLNLNTRVGQAIVNGGFRAGDWDDLVAGFRERLKRERNVLKEKNRSFSTDNRVLERCAELGLSMDQVQQLAAQDGCSIFYLLGLDPQTLEPLRS